jgi:hypothetical protein
LRGVSSSTAEHSANHLLGAISLSGFSDPAPLPSQLKKEREGEEEREKESELSIGLKFGQQL